jgi:parvulin-like peptidyl-prolyl isomerase
VSVFCKSSLLKYICVVTGFFCISLSLQAAPTQSAAATSSNSSKVAKDQYSGIFPEAVAKVNGDTISGSELEVEVRKEMIPMGNPKWTDLNEDYRGKLVYSILSSLINSKLVFDEAVARGATATDAEVQDEYLKLTQSFKNEDEMNKQFNLLKIDRAKAIEELYKNLVVRKFIDQNIRNRISVTPEEMARYYSEHPNEFKHPDIVRTSQILIQSDGSPESDARAKQQAMDILKRIENGEDFAELARQYSSAPSASRGGDIGLTARDALPPEYAEVAFSLGVGQVKMIKMDDGYYIVKVTDRKKEGVASLEETEDQLYDFLTEEKIQSELRKLVDRLRDQSDIEFLIPAGPSLEP